MKFEQELQTWLASEPQDVFEGGGIIAKVIDENAEVDWARDQLQKFAISVDPDPKEILSYLLSKGFGGYPSQLNGYDSSRIDYVLKHRRGIPISLGLVLLSLANLLDIRSAGVNCPGHFLVLLEDNLVDPLSLKFIDYDAFRQQLLKAEIPTPDVIEATTPQEIIGRMLFNLQVIAMSKLDKLRALEINDYLGIVLPENFRVPLSRSEIWVGMGDISAAKSECESALELAQSATIRNLIHQRLAQLDSMGPSEEMN